MKSNSNSPASVAPCCLMTIAGSDSGGNAGVQADLRAFHAYGLHGCTVFAALTAQNPSGVSGVMAVPADFVAAQLDAVLGVYAIRALKTGMLADVAAIEAIAARIGAHPEIAKVVDPVMIATSGVRLVSEDAVEAIKRRLLPLATIATPNLPEAEALCGLDPADGARGADAAHAAELAREICGRYGCATLVKGGHGSGQAAVDVLCTRAPDGAFAIREFPLPWIENPVSTHGTGCTLAAALAAELALGHGIEAAVAGAKEHVHRAIAGSYLVGDDCGVLGFAPMV